MRMKMVCDDRTLAEVANEFLALKKAQKVRERTLNDYKKNIDKFLEQGEAERMGKVAVPHKRWGATANQCVGTELQEIL